MTLKAFSVCLLGLALLSAQAFSQSIEREAGPLARFFPHWDEYLQTRPEERNAFSPAYIVSSDRGVDFEDIHMWYVDDETRIRLNIRDDGRIMNPPSQGLLDSSPPVWINQPAGAMSLTVQFEALLEPAADYDISAIHRAFHQLNQVMRQTGGVAALFAPEFKTAVFVFDGIVPEAWAIHEDGSRTELIVQENLARFHSQGRTMRNVIRLEFGHPPRRILLET